MVGWWVVSAKKEQTRMARVANLRKENACFNSSAFADEQFVSEEISQAAGLELLQTRDGNIDNQPENDRVESKRENAVGQGETAHAA